MANNCGKRTCPGNVAIIKILYYERNKERVKQKAKSRPVEDQRRYKGLWKKRNAGRTNASTAIRKERLKFATPPWLTDEHHAQIIAIYDDSARLTKETGVTHHVDHIVPIRGKNVSGLHVPWNLQILTADENYLKNNKFDETQI